MSGPWYPISILSWTSIVDIPSLVTVITFAIAVAMGTSIVHAATVIASTVIAWRFIIRATIGFNNALVGYISGVLVYWTTSTPTTSTNCAVGAGTNSALAIDARRRIGWPDVPRIIFIDYTSYIPHIPFIDQTVHFIDPIGT